MPITTFSNDVHADDDIVGIVTITADEPAEYGPRDITITFEFVSAGIPVIYKLTQNMFAVDKLCDVFTYPVLSEWVGRWPTFVSISFLCEPLKHANHVTCLPRIDVESAELKTLRDERANALAENAALKAENEALKKKIAAVATLTESVAPAIEPTKLDATLVAGQTRDRVVKCSDGRIGMVIMTPTPSCSLEYHDASSDNDLH